MWKHERQARELWNSSSFDAATRVAIITHLSEMVKSPEWTKEGGRYVPGPKKYLSERYWENTGPATVNHREECEQIWAAYLNETGEDKAFCLLNDARHQMLSARWTEALLRWNNDEKKAMGMIRDCIAACAESHEKKSVPKRLTLEAIFESAEKFERWLDEAHPCS